MTVTDLLLQSQQQQQGQATMAGDVADVRDAGVGAEAQHGLLGPSSSRGADEWGSLLAGFNTSGLTPGSILKFPSLELSPLPPTSEAVAADQPHVGTVEASLQLEARSHAVSSECTPQDAVEHAVESGSEQGRSSGKRTARLAGRKRADPERSARLREERAVRKREASKRRYAEQKSRLDFLQAREAGLRAQNESLRDRLARIRAEIAELSK